MTTLAPVGTSHSIPNLAGFAQTWHQPADDGRGFATHTIPFGATMGERFESSKGGQPSYPDRLRAYFGEPARPFGPRPYSVENYDLPDAYKGQNVFLSEILQRTILATDLFPIYDILPWKINPGMKIVWAVMKYDDHTLDHVPHEGVPRMVMSSSSQHSASMQRWGKAFILEHGFMETPAGRSNYVHNLVSISNAVLETCCWMAMNALMVVAPYNDGWARPSGSNISIGQLEDIFEEEMSMFAISVKDDNAMERVLDKLSARMTARGVTGANYFVAPKGMITACANHPSKRYFFLSGDKGGPHAPDTGGFRVRESRAFRDGWQPTPRDPLYREVAIGEFFIMGYMHLVGGIGNRGKTKFETEHLNTRIYSEKADAWREITMKEAVQNCGIYDADWNPTPLGRQFFGKIHSAESHRQIGPFQSWADWLAEYDPTKAVATAIAGLEPRALSKFLNSVPFAAKDKAKVLKEVGEAKVESGPRVVRAIAGLKADVSAPTPLQAAAVDDATQIFVAEVVSDDETYKLTRRQTGEDALPALRTGLAAVVAARVGGALVTATAGKRTHAERRSAALEELRDGKNKALTDEIVALYNRCAAVRVVVRQRRAVQLGPHATYNAEAIQKMDEALALADQYTGALLRLAALGGKWATADSVTPTVMVARTEEQWATAAQELEKATNELLEDSDAGFTTPADVEAWLARIPCTEGRFVRACLDWNVPCPLGVLLLRPHQTYLMGTGVLCVPGGAVGHTFFGKLDMELSDDGLRKVHIGNFTMYATALAMFTKNMCWAQNIHSARCVGGAGHTFWKYDELDSTVGGLSDHQQGELTADIFACAVPMNYKPLHGWHLDITGAYNPKLYAPQKPEPLHHPAAHIYSAYWGWNNQSHQAFLANTFFRDNAAPTANTICFQGHQFVADRRTGDLTVAITNRGHWGIQVGPGVRAVRHGTSSTMPQFDYTQQTRRFGSPV